MRPPLIEAAVMLAAARADPVGPALRDAIGRDPDWTVLIGMALHHGAAGLLCHRVLHLAAEFVPDEVRAAMGVYLESCAERHRIAVEELLAILDAFAAARVTAVPFKGPALAERFYAEPTLRRCLDLDVLIRRADLSAALAVLERLGFVSQYPDLTAEQRAAYHRYNGQDCLIAPGRAMPVEPHWALAPRTLAVSADVEALFQRAQPITLGGRAVPTLSAEDTLLVSALHASKEEWARLIWVADIAALLAREPSLDAQAVLARATASGVRRMLLIGIELAVRLLEAPCSRAFASALEADPAAQRAAAFAASRLWDERDVPSVFAFSSFRWWMRERWRDRVRYAAATVLTARVKHFQAVDLPRSLWGLYPLVRVGHDFLALPLWRLVRVPRLRSRA